MVSFSYQANSTCDESANQQDNVDATICQDVAPLQEVVEVICVDETNTPLSISPSSTVSSGDEFIVSRSSGAPLPESITCNVYTAPDTVLQRNTINLGGPLHLKEKYGSLQVESCDGQICLHTGTLLYTIFNEGSHSMTVKSITRTREGEPTADLVENLTPNPLALGGTATVSEEIDFDICQTTEVVTIVDVDAEPDDGPECDAFDNFAIKANPVCVMDVELTCTETETNEPCEDIMATGTPPCDCRGECARELSFVYTGEDCSSASGTVDGFVVSCSDTLSKPSTVLVTAVSGGVVLYNDTAVPGQVITMSDGGNCLGESVEILVSDADSLSTVYQNVVLESGCAEADGIALTDSAGAFEFVGFVCPDELSEYCIKDITLETCMVNEGTVPMSITGTDLVLNGEPLDISEIESLELRPGDLLCVSETTGINVCGEPTFEATVTVEADDTSNVGCSDTDTIIFTPAPRPTSSPTSPPTAVPTERIETRSPTPVPTAQIVTVPPPVYVPKPKPKPKAYYKGKGKGKGNVFSKGKGKGKGGYYYKGKGKGKGGYYYKGKGKGGYWSGGYYNKGKGGYSKGGYYSGGYGMYYGQYYYGGMMMMRK